MKKIVSRDGSYIVLHDDGQIWVSMGDITKVSSPGYVTNHACTCYTLLGVDPRYNKYFAVDYKLVRFADRLKIRKLRLVRSSVKKVKYGQKLVVAYGYIDSTKFPYLMKRRKRRFRSGGVQEVLLLKYSDAKWRDE